LKWWRPGAFAQQSPWELVPLPKELVPLPIRASTSPRTRGYYMFQHGTSHEIRDCVTCFFKTGTTLWRRPKVKSRAASKVAAQTSPISRAMKPIGGVSKEGAASFPSSRTKTQAAAVARETISRTIRKIINYSWSRSPLAA
jgi:hypothetical protein